MLMNVSWNRECQDYVVTYILACMLLVFQEITGTRALWSIIIPTRKDEEYAMVWDVLLWIILDTTFFFPLESPQNK